MIGMVNFSVISKISIYGPVDIVAGVRRCVLSCVYMTFIANR